MSWNYRIVKYRDKTRGFGLHEVYYTKKGKARAMSAEPVCFEGNTKKDLKWALSTAFSDALHRPIFKEPKNWNEGVKK